MSPIRQVLLVAARDFRERKGFTYSILDGDDVIGCIYIYPPRTQGTDASVVAATQRPRKASGVVAALVRSHGRLQGERVGSARSERPCPHRCGMTCTSPHAA